MVGYRAYNRYCTQQQPSRVSCQRAAAAAASRPTRGAAFLDGLRPFVAARTAIGTHRQGFFSFFFIFSSFLPFACRYSYMYTLARKGGGFVSAASPSFLSVSPLKCFLFFFFIAYDDASFFFSFFVSFFLFSFSLLSSRRAFYLVVENL